MKSRVLIVDDDRNLRVTLAEILQSCGFETLEAENSTEALPIIREKDPDLVFCDWKMPGGGGDDLLRALQARQRIQNLPVIVMTAYGTSGNAIKAIAATGFILAKIHGRAGGRWRDKTSSYRCCSR